MRYKLPLFAIMAAICLAGMELAAAADAPSIPEGVVLPLVIYDVNWNDQAVGYTPQRAGKDWLEAAARSPWQTLPWRTYSQLDYVTRDRTAVVHEQALGLGERPLLFSVADNRHPTWGPRMSFSIPHAIRLVGRRYRISLDVSMASLGGTRSGGVSLEGIGHLSFNYAGDLLFNGSAIGRYRPDTPLHVEFTVDVPNRRVVVRVDDDELVDAAWPEKARGFHGLRLHGIMPGGYAQAPLRLAFDNIKIVMEE